MMHNTLGVVGGRFRVIGDEKEECDRSTVAFCDDAFYLAGGPCTSSPRRSAELKLAVASLFFDSTGIKLNASKTECCAMEWAWSGPRRWLRLPLRKTKDGAHGRTTSTFSSGAGSYV